MTWVVINECCEILHSCMKWTEQQWVKVMNGSWVSRVVCLCFASWCCCWCWVVNAAAVKPLSLRNHRWGGCVYVLQMFFIFVLLFPSVTKIPDNRSRERLNGFSWNLPNDSGESVVSNVVPPPGEWRMLMICVIYTMTGAITRGRHTWRLRYKVISGRMDLI